MNAFVAGFIGTVNRLEAVGAADGRWQVLGRSVPAERPGHEGLRDVAAIRPEQLAIDPAGDGWGERRLRVLPRTDDPGHRR